MQPKLTAVLLFTLVACSGEIEAPCGEPRIVATDDASLASALAEATSGTCIVLREGIYAGPVDITTDGVTIVSATGEKATIQGSPGEPGIRITAEGVKIVGVDVREGDRGVLILASSGSLDLMEISAAREAAVGIKCEDQDCLRPTAMITLTSILIRDGDAGLVVDGARVVVTDSTLRDQTTEQLAGGGGVYVYGGGDLTLERSTIDGNQYGVVADGANTKLAIRDGRIDNNDDGGVWAQGLDGVDAFTVVGTIVEANGLVGIGTIGSKGVSLTNVEIRSTVLKPVSIDTMTTVDVGDGIGLFAGSENVSVTGGALIDNARAQGVVDVAGPGIVFDANVTASGGMHNIVVQRSNTMISIPMTLRSEVVSPLFVRQDLIQVPRLP